MINLNQDETYYKDLEFLRYMLAVGEHASEHEAPETSVLFFLTNGTVRFFDETYDFSSEQQREILADLACDFVNKWPSPMLSFRCDFDFRMTSVEECHAEEDERDILELIKKYSKETGSQGFGVFHKTQHDAVDGKDVPLAEHLHYIYEDTGAKTLVEYIHANIT